MWCHWEFFLISGFLLDWVTLSDRLLWQTRHNINSTDKRPITINTINSSSIVGSSTLTASPSSMVSPTLIWMRRPNRAFMPRSFSLFISCVWSSYSRNGSRLLIAVAFPSPWAFFLVRHNLAWGEDWVRGKHYTVLHLRVWGITLKAVMCTAHKSVKDKQHMWSMHAFHSFHTQIFVFSVGFTWPESDSPCQWHWLRWASRSWWTGRRAPCSGDNSSNTWAERETVYSTRRTVCGRTHSQGAPPPRILQK